MRSFPAVNLTNAWKKFQKKIVLKVALPSYFAAAAP